MKRIRQIVLGLLVAFIGFLFWYKYMFSMDTASPFTIGRSDAPQRLLIAYQGSSYKNSLVETVSEHFSSSDIFIKGIDIEELSVVEPTEWTAIFICHTWEIWRAPGPVKAFHDTHSFLRHVVYFTTSGDGHYHLEGVDAITSESVLSDAQVDAEKAILRLEAIID